MKAITTIKKLKEEYNLKDKQLLNILFGFVKFHFIAYEELETYIIQEQEKKLNLCHSRKVISV